MKKGILLAGILISGLFGTGAQAEKLNQKWDAPRSEAQTLAEAVTGGDAASLKTLQDLAHSGHMPAVYELGGLIGNNIIVRNNDDGAQPACSLYQTAAQGEYPPAQAAFAICHLGGTLREEGNHNQASQARSLMADAAKSGWTPAALYLARYYAGFIPQTAGEWEDIHQGNEPASGPKDLGEFHLSNAQFYIKHGLNSDPNTEQSTTFNFLLGILAAKKADRYGISKNIFSSAEGIAFWQGADALQKAIEKGSHAPSLTVMAHLKSRWLFELEQISNSTHKFALSSSYDEEKKCLAEGAKLGLKCRQFRDNEAQWFAHWEREYERALYHFDKDYSEILVLAEETGNDRTYAGWREACAGEPFSAGEEYLVPFVTHLVCTDIAQTPLRWQRETQTSLDWIVKDHKENLENVRRWSENFQETRRAFKKKWQHTYDG